MCRYPLGPPGSIAGVTDALAEDFWREALSAAHRRGALPLEGSAEQRVLDLIEASGVEVGVALVVCLALTAPKDDFALAVLGAGPIETLLEHYVNAAARPLAAAAAKHEEVAQALRAAVPPRLDQTATRLLAPWLRTEQRG